MAGEVGSGGDLDDDFCFSEVMERIGSGCGRIG